MIQCKNCGADLPVINGKAGACTYCTVSDVPKVKANVNMLGTSTFKPGSSYFKLAAFCAVGYSIIFITFFINSAKVGVTWYMDVLSICSSIFLFSGIGFTIAGVWKRRKANKQGP